MATTTDKTACRPTRFQNAVLIVDPGACNPSGIAHSIIEACREVREEGGDVRADPAVRLMITQLTYICRANSDIADYGQLLAACRARAQQP